MVKLRDEKWTWEDEEERMRAALEDVAQGKPKRQAARDNKIEITKLRRTIERVKEGGPVVVSRGRAPLIPPEFGLKIQAKCALKDLSQSSVDAIGFRQLVEEINKEEEEQGRKDPTYHPMHVEFGGDTNIEKIIKKWLPDKVPTATKQSERRINAALDASNFLSLLATWRALITEGGSVPLNNGVGSFPPDLIFNMDTTNIFVGDTTKAYVYLAPGSKQLLKELNKCPGVGSVQSEAFQRRAVQLVVLTNAAGQRLQTVVKINDNDTKKLRCFQLAEDIQIIVFCKKDHDPEMTRKVMSIMLDTMIKERKKLYNLRTQQNTTDSGTSNSQDNKNSSETDLRMVLTLDGEFEQIDLILNDIIASHKDICFYKFAAACSSSQQANDVMRSFMIVKQLEKWYRYNGADVIHTDMYEQLEKKWNKKKILANASKNTILQFIKHLPSILSQAYTVNTVQHGWKRTGLVPFDPKQIIRQWPYHKQLTVSERDTLIQRSQELVPVVIENGYVPENKLEETLTAVLVNSKQIGYKAGYLPTLKVSSSSSASAGPTNIVQLPPADVEGSSSSSGGTKPTRLHKPLDARPTNHQRCLLLHHPVVFVKHLVKKDAQQAAKDKKEAAKKRKLENPTKKPNKRTKSN